MKKYFILVSASSLLLLIPVFVFAAYNDVQMSSDGNAIINTASINLSVSGSQANLDSITVETGNFQVVMSGNSYIQVTSSDRRRLTVSGDLGSVTQSFTCTASESVLSLNNPSTGAQVTLTVTPETSTCVVSGGGGGGGSSGGSSGGGGGGSAPVIPPQTPSPAAPSTPATPREAPAAPATPSEKAKPSSKAISVSPVFTRTLKSGAVSLDVKKLQQILNSDPDTAVALKGVGSLGKETTKFGPATKKAVQKFQEKYGIAMKGDTGYGVVGPATRMKMNELFGQEKKAETSIKKNGAKKTIKKNGNGTSKKSSSKTSKEDLEKQIKALEAQLKLLGL